MDNKLIYEQHDWEKLTHEHLKGKIEKVLSMIPRDVVSIVDVGCGNGAITNVLAEKYDVTGVDRSQKSLSFVNTKKLEASCDQIPLTDQSFDMVFSSELLEHLEDDVFYKTIAEFDRLSKKYLFITVPNDENPGKLSIKCPKCGYIYNRPNHLRSFRKEDFRNLVDHFEMVTSIVFGEPVRYYQPALLTLKRRISPSSSWVPYLWIGRNDRKTICPRCENIFTYHYRFHPFAFLCDVINVLVSPKKPYWLFVLLKRKSPAT
jgi:SAM-dependent methyltransferase